MQKAPPKSFRVTQGQGSRPYSITGDCSKSKHQYVVLKESKHQCVVLKVKACVWCRTSGHQRREGSGLFCLTALNLALSDALHVAWSFQLNLSVSLVFPSLILLSSINAFSLPSSAELQKLVKLAMDALVAQFSRPAFEDEGYSSEDQQELTQVTPPLSLKFALPPIAQVCLSQASKSFD